MASRRDPRRPEYQQQSFSTDRPNEFTKLDLKPRRFHFYNVLLFIFGTFVPPLAVAARFGIGTDFWLNVVLTLCGYIPGHGHNFYIQNIRNNKNHRRTPKWAIKYGLVDDSEIRRRTRRSQWAVRYNERLPQSALEGEAYAEGQIPDRHPSQTSLPPGSTAERPLWNRDDDESFYGSGGGGRKKRNDGASVDSSSNSHSGGRWHYPANFDDADVSASNNGSASKLSLKRKKKKKDRWELSEDARMGIIPDGEDTGGKRKKKKKSKVKRTKGGDQQQQVDPSDSRSDIVEPEDPVGGLYSDRGRALEELANPPKPKTQEDRERQEREMFNHEF